MPRSRRGRISWEKHGVERTKGFYRRKGEMSSAKIAAQHLDYSPLHFIPLLYYSLVLQLNVRGRYLSVELLNQQINK